MPSVWRSEDVPGPDHARCVAGRTERLRESSCRSPAGAVSRRHEARLDPVEEILHGGGDAGLDTSAGEVEAAQHEVDRGVRKQPPCLEADVDDARVRAGGEDRGAPAADAGGEEALVVDLR